MKILQRSSRVRRGKGIKMKISAFIHRPVILITGQAGSQHDARGPFILIVLSLFFLSSCIAYAPVPGPAVYRVSSYRIAWENALRAAEDVGIRITLTDESSGTIEGQADRTAVTIHVTRQPDERIRLEVSLQGPSRDSYIADEFHRAYERRVGRY